jgi:hypothetical protein
MQDVPARPRSVGEHQLRRFAPQRANERLDVRLPRADRPEVDRRIAAPLVRVRHADEVLVAVHPDVKSSRLCHG